MKTSSNGSMFRVRGIHRSPVNSHYKDQWRGALIFFFDLRLKKRLSKQSRRWWLSGVPDLFDRNKILSGGDLSHYQVPHCIRVFFYLFDLCLFITIFNFILNYVLIVTFWIFTYHKIWILLIIFCFIWNYWIIYFFNMFGSVLECCELTGVSLLWPWLIKWK